MSLLTLIRQAFTIPYGWEDENGFHFGHDPRRNLTEQARVLSLRASTPACRNSAAVAGVGLVRSPHDNGVGQ